MVVSELINFTFEENSPIAWSFVFVVGCSLSVECRAKKIQEHRRRQERKKEERAEKLRQKQREQAKKRYEQQKQKKAEEPPRFTPGGGMPSGFPGMSELLSDPELLTAFQDPEVAEAFRDVSQNPANMTKYLTNPKVTKIIGRLSSKFGGGGGAGFGANMPFFRTAEPTAADGAAKTQGSTATTKPDLDVD